MPKSLRNQQIGLCLNLRLHDSGSSCLGALLVKPSFHLVDLVSDVSNPTFLLVNPSLHAVPEVIIPSCVPFFF